MVRSAQDEEEGNTHNWGPESAWSIATLSASLSWLESYLTDSTPDVLSVLNISMRRSLIYPYLRLYSLSQMCLNDVVCVLGNGKSAILKCLLSARECFRKVSE